MVDRGEDWGWKLILQARAHDWAAAPRTCFETAGTRLEVSLGGRWRCAPTATPAAAALFDVFLPLVARTAPLAIGQIGQSLDGRIATAGGASHYINGAPARAHLHRLRAVVDAVVVGVGTVNADDPQLTVRHVAGPDPVRVVLDPRGRAAPASRLFREPAAPTLHLCAGGRGEDDAAMAGAGHVLRAELSAGAAGFAPATVLAWLAARGLRRVLVEGGGVTVSRFVAAGALDRLHVMVAPLLIGSGRPGLALAPVTSLDEALRPTCRTFACGDDTLFDLALRPA